MIFLIMKRKGQFKIFTYFLFEVSSRFCVVAEMTTSKDVIFL
jgi:hypothetical protein